MMTSVILGVTTALFLAVWRVTNARAEKAEEAARLLETGLLPLVEEALRGAIPRSGEGLFRIETVKHSPIDWEFTVREGSVSPPRARMVVSWATGLIAYWTEIDESVSAVPFTELPATLNRLRHFLARRAGEVNAERELAHIRAPGRAQSAASTVH